MHVNFKKASLLGAVALAFVSVSAYAVNPGGGSGRAPANKLIVGDSIFALSGDIRSDLQDDLNEDINSSARSGCQMIGGNNICSSRFAVPRQYANADKTGITTVIMDGGGNDFLIGNACPALTVADCQEAIQAIEEAISDLAAQMHSDGITKIVFLGYYNAPGAPQLTEINNFDSDLKAQTYPAQGITYVETRPAFADPTGLVVNDGIHPSAQGSRVLTDLIEQVL